MMTNCKNCGAPLNANGNCDYCDTKYRRTGDLKLDIQNASKIKVVLPNGQEIEMWGYVSELEFSQGEVLSYRTFEGELRRVFGRPLAKITFLGEVYNAD